MPEFYWRAAQSTGAIVDGRSNAATAAQLIRQLRGQGLTPLSVEDALAHGMAGGGAKARAKPASFAPAAGPATAQAAQAAQAAKVAAAPQKVGAPRIGKTKGPVKAADVLSFTSELAIMLRAGLPLDNALRVLVDMSYKPSVTSLLQAVLADVKRGMPFSQALAERRELFGDFYINMVHSGEVSGQLSAVLVRLVEHLERQRALREAIVSAMMYPMILLSVAVLSLVAILGFVVPQFEKMFKSMGDALPLMTRFVVALGHGFSQYGLYLLVAVVLLVWALRRWLRTPGGQMWWQAKALRLPVMGELVRKYQLTLFSRALGTLLGNGVPMLTALHIATASVGNIVLRAPLEKVIPHVKEGGRLVDAIAGTGIFEPLAVNLVRVGEETGRIGGMMLELADILNREVETGIKRTLTLLEPVMILVLGLLIALIIISILMGVMSINDLAA